MNLKKRLATVLWLGLALAASAMAAPPSPAQDHDGGVGTSLVKGGGTGGWKCIRGSGDQ